MFLRGWEQKHAQLDRVPVFHYKKVTSHARGGLHEGTHLWFPLKTGVSEGGRNTREREKPSEKGIRCLRDGKVSYA